MMEPLILRAASGPEVGVGHLARTRALAQKLEARGLVHRLLVDDPHSVEWLRRRGVDAELAGGELPAGRALWLDGFRDWERELDQAAERGMPAVLVENRIADRGRASAVVYPAMHWTPDGWDRQHGERVFGGPGWVPLSTEVLELQREEPSIELLVTFGGCDPAGLTERSLESLARLGFGQRIVVVVGPRMEPRIGELERLASALPRAELVPGRDGIGPLMARSRRVLTAVGTTLYELAWLGVPALVLANYPSDREALEWYGRNGPHLPLGVAPELGDAELDALFLDHLRTTRRRVRPEPCLELGRGAAHLADLLTDRSHD